MGFFVFWLVIFATLCGYLGWMLRVLGTGSRQHRLWVQGVAFFGAASGATMGYAAGYQWATQVALPSGNYAGVVEGSMINAFTLKFMAGGAMVGTAIAIAYTLWRKPTTHLFAKPAPSRSEPTSRQRETLLAFGVLIGAIALISIMPQPLHQVLSLFFTHEMTITTVERHPQLPPASWPMMLTWTRLMTLAAGLVCRYSLAAWWWRRYLPTQTLKPYWDWALVGGWSGGGLLAMLAYVGAVTMMPPIVPHSPTVSGHWVWWWVWPAVWLGAVVGSVQILGWRLRLNPQHRQQIQVQAQALRQARQSQPPWQDRLKSPLALWTGVWFLLWLGFILLVYRQTGQLWGNFTSQFGYQFYWLLIGASLVVLGASWGGLVGWLRSRLHSGSALPQWRMSLGDAGRGAIAALSFWGLGMMTLFADWGDHFGWPLVLFTHPLYPALLLGWATAASWLAIAPSLQFPLPWRVVVTRGAILGASILAALTLWQTQGWWLWSGILPVGAFIVILLRSLMLGGGLAIVLHYLAKQPRSRVLLISLTVGGILLLVQLLLLFVVTPLIDTSLGNLGAYAPSRLAVVGKVVSQVSLRTVQGAIFGMMGVGLGTVLQQKLAIAPTPQPSQQIKPKPKRSSQRQSPPSQPSSSNHPQPSPETESPQPLKASPLAYATIAELPPPPKPPQRQSQDAAALQTLLQRAQAGEAEAIATLLNRNLKTKGFRVQVKWQDNVLWFQVTGAIAPPKEKFLKFLRQGLVQLNVPKIKTVRVIAKTAAGRQWQGQFELN